MQRYFAAYIIVYIFFGVLAILPVTWAARNSRGAEPLNEQSIGPVLKKVLV